MLPWLLGCSERFEAPDTATVVSPYDDRVDTDADGPLGLCINELMPDNEASVADERGAYSDWIELHNPTDAAIDLEGWYLSDSRLQPTRHTLGALTLAAGEFRVLWADGQPELGSAHLGFSLDADGGEVALHAPDGRGSIVTYGPIAADFSLARLPDCCEGDACLGYDFRGSPAASNVDPVYEAVPIVPVGAAWSYWDQGVHPGLDWTALAFDDAAWPVGAGPLGYGDAHIVTAVGYGADPNNKYITTWFRARFDAPARTLDRLTLGLLRDDGAVVYLNGVEIARDNLPTDAITDVTLATVSIPAAEETAYFAFALDPNVLQAGANVLAVEVHQAAVSSSDLGFDLTLTGESVVPTE